jgi:hypothetical protein
MAMANGTFLSCLKKASCQRGLALDAPVQREIKMGQPYHPLGARLARVLTADVVKRACLHGSCSLPCKRERGAARRLPPPDERFSHLLLNPPRYFDFWYAAQMARESTVRKPPFSSWYSASAEVPPGDVTMFRSSAG